MSDTSYMSDISNIIVALCALVGLPTAAFEYWRAKRQARLELAQLLLADFSKDEMIQFAVTSLDWAWGLIPVPMAWRDIVKKAAVRPDARKLISAIRPNLTEDVAEDPEALLYRHAFVNLFNAIERMADLVDGNVVKASDLAPVVWVLRELKDWRYGGPVASDEQFIPALNAWYKKGKLVRFIDSVIAQDERNSPLTCR